MKKINWDLIVETMKSDLIDFASGQMSSHNFYKIAVLNGIGPEVRSLVRPGAERARKMAKDALRRRSVVVTKVPTHVNI
jgi:hypothetical protein